MTLAMIPKLYREQKDLLNRILADRKRLAEGLVAELTYKLRCQGFEQDYTIGVAEEGNRTFFIMYLQPPLHFSAGGFPIEFHGMRVQTQKVGTPTAEPARPRIKRRKR